MLETIGFLLGAGMTTGAVGAGYIGARRFVKERLRYVDEVHNARAPLVAGTVATLVAVPVVALVPLIGGVTAVLFGVSVGAGTKAGAREIRRWIGGG